MVASEAEFGKEDSRGEAVSSSTFNELGGEVAKFGLQTYWGKKQHWEGLWHQNCGYTSPILFFGGGKRNQWKIDFFCKTLRTRKFSRGKFFGASTHGILTHSGFRKCIWKVGKTNFWPCFCWPKLGECDKMGSVSKIMRCSKKMYLPQFSNLSFQT